MAADPVHRIRRSSAQHRTPDRPDDDQLTLPLFDARQSDDAAAIDNADAEEPAGVGGDGRRAGEGHSAGVTRRDTAEPGTSPPDKAGALDAHPPR